MAREGTKQEKIWKVKTAAWIHDPGEKALVLLRAPEGHEGGTVRQLRQQLFGAEGVPKEIADVVARADQWAAASDRPRMSSSFRVRFDQQPVLIHPLDGSQYDLKSLEEVSVRAIRAVSFDHFRDLVQRQESDETDWKKTFLTLWRQGPESPAPQLGALWAMLPADTRIPAYSIWEHLDLTSALAGAMALDPGGTPALLKFTIGPVQGFIEQARTSSDLWAGSHLLSRIMWEGMKAVCDQLGPDAVIFPNLRGVPLVDAWLANEVQWAVGGEELRKRTDENPLFAACLVNVAVIVVPESMASRIAEDMSNAMRTWACQRVEAAAEEICRVAGIQLSGEMKTQVEKQVCDFPEVYWSVAPWSVVQADGQKLDVTKLQKLLDQFYGGGAEHFLNSSAWKDVLSREILSGQFYKPNPGVLYPALYDLLDRALGAAKAARCFQQLEQQGYRCTLCGEREWLTADPSDLDKPRGQRGETLWHLVAQRKPAWCRPDSQGQPREYLCALCTLKRLWPNLFREEVRESFRGQGGEAQSVQRYVISTHTMALAPTLEAIADQVGRGLNDKQEQAMEGIFRKFEENKLDRVALPARLFRKARNNDETLKLIGGIPALLDQIADEEENSQQAEKTRKELTEAITTLAGGRKPERYYALLLLDGDRMGGWVSGNEDDLILSFEKLWHPEIRREESLQEKQFQEYRQTRAVSPARHAFLSRALNSFAVHLARPIIEELHMGKLLYAGGDDVLAMTSVNDLLGVLAWLRCAYSGVEPGGHFAAAGKNEGVSIRLDGSHALLEKREGDKRLLALMGKKATVSAGIVVAHYTAPLEAVLRELRRAEARAKGNPGKNSFSLTLMKRSGGATFFTAHWGKNQSPVKTLEILDGLRELFAKTLSRQAAYAALDWVSRLKGGGNASPGSLEEMLGAILRREFLRHVNRAEATTQQSLSAEVENIVRDLVGLVPCTADPVDFLHGAIQTAEFLAREGRVR